MKSQTAIPNLIIALCAAFFLLVGFGGCDTRADGKDPVQVKKDEQVAQVAANLKPIGRSLENTGRPAEGQAVQSQAAVLDEVVGLKPEERPAPIASYAEWLALKDDKQAALDMAERFKRDAAAKADELAAVKEENNSWWAWVKGSASVAGLLTTAAGVLRALNVPGSQLIDPVVRVLLPKSFEKLNRKVDELGTQNATLVTAVTASDVGREALAHLDAQLAQNPTMQKAVMNAISGVTGGKADTLEDFFKTFAKAAAVDEGKAPEVDRMLSTIRNDAPTTGGSSDSFLKIAATLGTLLQNGRGLRV